MAARMSWMSSTRSRRPNLVRALRHGVTAAVMGTLLATNLAAQASAASRIKDIATFEGIRDNFLVGYGLVVGLNGKGDSLGNSPFTKQSLEAMLERLGVNTRGTNLKTKNVAAVMVTAELPPFSRQGTRIDVNLSTMGDAKELLGGTLLATPLLGADGEIYAVAQGTLTVGGFTIQGEAETVTKGVPTAARIANGGIVEREVDFVLGDLSEVKIALFNPDLTTARRVSQAINSFMGADVTRALDPGTVQLSVPDGNRHDLVGLLTDIEQLRIAPDQPARVVIEEVSGTIVIGQDVTISTVAIAQGTLTVRVTETPQVSQPQAFSQTGTTQNVARTDIQFDDQSDKKMAIIPATVSLRELVDGLNALGVGPRDMISILQAIKAAGALQAEIVVM
jgi:flagellar P-ring protein precursor FlgI